MARSNVSSAPVALRTKTTHALAQQMAALLLLCLSLTSPVDAGTIFPQKPSKDGMDTFTVTLNDGTVKTFDVSVTKGMSSGDKRDALVNAASAAGLIATPVWGNGIEVQDTTHIAWTSTSGEETDKLSQVLFPTDGSAVAQIDLHLQPTFASLAGFNSDGGAATYTAGFEFSSPSLGNISLFTSLGFSDLTTPTVNGLLLQEFDLLLNQLQVQAPSLVSGLSLNLPEGAIVFQPSGLFTSYSATNGTTDVALISTLSVSTIPEPSNLILMGTGLLLGLGCYARGRSPDRRRRFSET